VDAVAASLKLLAGGSRLSWTKRPSSSSATPGTRRR
jgi:hypothetical protein